MPWSGGVYTRGYASWTADANASLPISATKFDVEDNDFAAGLNNCLTKDGLSIPNAPIGWGVPFTIAPAPNLNALTLGPTGTGKGLVIAASAATGNVIDLALASGQPAINMTAAAASEILALQIRQGTQPYWQMYQLASDTGLAIGVSTLVPAVLYMSAANGQVQVYEPNFSALALKNVATTDFATISVSYAGFTGTVTGNVRWLREGDQISIFWDSVTGTSNGTSFGASGVLPAAIRPPRTSNSGSVTGTNNSVNFSGAIAQVTTAGDFGFYADGYGTPFANSGTKTIAAGFMTYTLQP